MDGSTLRACEFGWRLLSSPYDSVRTLVAGRVDLLLEGKDTGRVLQLLPLLATHLDVQVSLPPG